MKAILAQATEHFGLVGVLATLGILALVGLVVGMDALQAWVVSAGVFAPLAFVVLKAATIIIAPLSGGPLYPIVGALFGFWPGILYVALGDLLGYTGAFFISRIFGYPFVHKLIAKGEHALLRKVVHHAGTTRGFFHMILTFFAMPELICYGSGLSKFPYWKFISILWPLSWLVSSALVLLGASLGAEASAGYYFIIPLIGAVVIALGVWFFMRGVHKEP